MATIKKMLDDILYDGVYSVFEVVGMENVPIVFANESGMEPESTYCIIDVLGFEQTGLVYESTFVSPAKYDQLWSVTQYKLKTQFTFLGDQSEDYGWEFRHHVVNNRVCTEALQRKNLSIAYRSDLRNSPQPRETRWMDSQAMDLHFNLALRTKQDIDWVEFITINGTEYRIYNNE